LSKTQLESSKDFPKAFCKKFHQEVKKMAAVSAVICISFRIRNQRQDTARYSVHSPQAEKKNNCAFLRNCGLQIQTCF